MKKGFSFLLMLIIAQFVTAQKKPLSIDQYFKNNFTGIINAAPSTVNWIDNTHFIITKENKKWVVNAMDGREREANENDKAPSLITPPVAYFRDNNLYIKEQDVDIQLTFDEAKEVNPTMSPDNKFVAYTKNNDLYKSK